MEKSEKKKIKKILQLTLSDGKNYVLASDGNVYYKNEDGTVKKLDSQNENERKMLKEMQSYFKSPEIDVIYGDR